MGHLRINGKHWHYSADWFWRLGKWRIGHGDPSILGGGNINQRNGGFLYGEQQEMTLEIEEVLVEEEEQGCYGGGEQRE